MNIFEINAIRDAAHKRERDRQRFEAMLHKGVDIHDESTDGETTFEDIKRRAEAKVRGISEEEQEFNEVGIKIIEE